MSTQKQTLDDLLNKVSYQFLNSSEYVPSEFALTFMNFIKLVNWPQGESNKTPPVHLAMLDKIATRSPYIVNLCFRGAAKTTLFMEYLVLFLAVFHHLPGFGPVEGIIYVTDSMENGARSARKNIEYRYNNSDFLKTWIPEAHFTDSYIEFTNKNGERLGVRLFGAKTGLRGTKIFSKRPVLAILDDLIADEDANSKTIMKTIRDTIYKGVFYALDPTRHKVIFNGTPFNKEDVIVQAVESGAWDVNVWPVCEHWPCEEKEFSGAWPDRFTYEYVKKQYEMAMRNGEIDAFLRELMLRISVAENRLIQDTEIRWYSRQKLLENRHFYNFYITTDLATSKKQSADWNVISVWAYNANGDWFWVDGICKRQTMDKTLDDLFRLVQEYNPQQVGIEVTGQQGGFIPWFQQEMMTRNIWFNFASNQKNNEPGIRPTKDKLTRFNLVVPWFKAGKFYFPLEMRTTPIIGECMSQLALATIEGFKGKDDFLDTISMLAYLKPWKPSATLPANEQARGLWSEPSTGQANPLSSYIV